LLGLPLLEATSIRVRPATTAGFRDHFGLASLDRNGWWPDRTYSDGDMITRRCVFCGQPGKLTNEDAWPRWLITHCFPKGSQVKQRWGSDQGLVGFTSRKQNVTVRRVCADCNNGWMSDLEVAVQPLLLPWIDGQRTRMLYDEQQVMATWAIKTAMMLQYTPMYKAGMVIPGTQYDLLFQRKTRPPDSVEVLIGLELTEPEAALFGLRRVDVAREHWTEALTPTFERYIGYEATLIAKGLVLKILGHAGPTQIKMTKEVVTKSDLTQIWPVQSSGGILLPARRSD
jgi:hypothetical protein